MLVLFLSFLFGITAIVALKIVNHNAPLLSVNINPQLSGAAIFFVGFDLVVDVEGFSYIIKIYF